MIAWMVIEMPQDNAKFGNYLLHTWFIELCTLKKKNQSFDDLIKELKSFLFSIDHRGARKMILFYYRGFMNHNIEVPSI